MRLAARFSGFVVFIIWMFSIAQVQAQDYVLAFNDRYSWRVDVLPVPCDDCRDIVRFDRNYVMYVLIEKMLYVLQPDGSEPAVFDLTLAWLLNGVSVPYDDMIPFEDGTIYFLSSYVSEPERGTGKQFLQYDMRNQTMSFIDSVLRGKWGVKAAYTEGVIL